MPLTRLPLAAALLALALSAGAARAEQVAITGQTGSPLTTTDGAGNTVNSTTRQTFNGFTVTPSGNGAVVIGQGPLPTSCGPGGAVDGAAYNRSGTLAICVSAALTWSGAPLTWGGVPITGL